MSYPVALYNELDDETVESVESNAEAYKSDIEIENGGLMFYVGEGSLINEEFEQMDLTDEADAHNRANAAATVIDYFVNEENLDQDLDYIGFAESQESEFIYQGELDNESRGRRPEPEQFIFQLARYFEDEEIEKREERQSRELDYILEKAPQEHREEFQKYNTETEELVKEFKERGRPNPEDAADTELRNRVRNSEVGFDIEKVNEIMNQVETIPDPVFSETLKSYANKMGRKRS